MSAKFRLFPGFEFQPKTTVASISVQHDAKGSELALFVCLFVSISGILINKHELHSLLSFLVLITRKCSLSGLRVLIEILACVSWTLTTTLPALQFSPRSLYIHIDVRITHDAHLNRWSGLSIHTCPKTISWSALFELSWVWVTGSAHCYCFRKFYFYYITSQNHSIILIA